jgi:hypothetical protein
MLIRRTSISAAKKDFISEISRLRRFDHKNQINFSNGAISQNQIELLVEAIFFSAFRAYENFIREIFLLHCMGKKWSKQRKPVSYLRSLNFGHTERLIKSAMQFLDWTSPDTVVTRSELYLKDGFPFKTPITSNISELRDFKKLRNHIAHNSPESYVEFQKVVKNYYTTLPLSIPTTGEYLMLPSKVNPSNYILIDCFDLMEEISNHIT